MKQDEKGEKRSVDGVGESQHTWRWFGRATSDSPSFAPQEASGYVFASDCSQAHVQNIGWQNEVCNGVIAGTVGQSLRLEAIRILLVRRF